MQGTDFSSAAHLRIAAIAICTARSLPAAAAKFASSFNANDFVMPTICKGPLPLSQNFFSLT